MTFARRVRGRTILVLVVGILLAWQIVTEWAFAAAMWNRLAGLFMGDW
jgi:hypothetical protein